MKKAKYLILLLVAALILPVSVFAEEEKDSKEVKVYLFRGEGCPHCQEAQEWFKSIDEEHGSKFKIIEYETWYNEENAELMEKVAKAREEEAPGVPYIIIGNKSWNGFTDSYKNEILSEIDSEYQKDVSKRYDIMKLIKSGKTKKENHTSDILTLLVILVVTGGIGFGIYKTRETVK